jgi:multidrug efflux system outer membrane protein
MMPRFPLLGVPLAVLAVGCRVGPEYQRPDYPVPASYRGLEDEAAPSDPTAPTFGDFGWLEVFDDPVLQDLIQQGLAANYDVRLAAERVLEGEALLRIARADLYPDVRAGGTYDITRTTENGAVPLPIGVDRTQRQWSLFGDLSWELDFWGRFASESEAARASLLATEFVRHMVIQTLVCDLAQSYFELLELDRELEIATRTYESRQRSFELVSLRLDQGVANKVEYYQAESLVLQTAGLIPAFEQRIQQQENLIQLLVGGNPGPVSRGRRLMDQDRKIEIPAGLPSELLTRRPDVRASEQQLIAANARIGEARALLYPSIRLTALGGVASQNLSDLFEGGSSIWNIAPSVVLPIFNASRLRSNVEVTESQQRQATLDYLHTLQRAFREVSDALIAHAKREEVRDWREKLELTLREQVALSNDRYLGGVTSYLEVLDSERDHFDAEIALAQSIRDELFAYVSLYRALGAGWQDSSSLPPPVEVGASTGKQVEGSGP